MKSLTKVISFVLFTPILISSLVLLLIISTSRSLPSTKVLASSTGTLLEPSQFPLTLGLVKHTDGRAQILSEYLKKYSSPLEPFSDLIVSISDKYSLDYRLLVAIAQQESNLCKKIPENSYNCWGFGIYGDKVTRFDNYPQGIEIVAKTLKIHYLDKGLDTPEKIMAKYTPPSLEKGGPWAKGVNQFLSDLE